MINMGRMGFPVTKDQWLDSFCLLVKNLERPKSLQMDDQVVIGMNYLRKGIPKLANKLLKITSRAAATENKIRNWHKETEEYFISSNNNITDPKRICNIDESDSLLSPEGCEALAKKGIKLLHNRSGDDEECLTVLVTANAAVQLAPPMVLK
uniref:Uncharacterized protein LOC114330938 n=1 Tax=Diabrotica virgifera virgifera TaxID=50390 RepID=A0A6P7FTA5_DIAVI